jgi:hypothetical protein
LVLVVLVKLTVIEVLLLAVKTLFLATLLLLAAVKVEPKVKTGAMGMLLVLLVAQEEAVVMEQHLLAGWACLVKATLEVQQELQIQMNQVVEAVLVLLV